MSLLQYPKKSVTSRVARISRMSDGISSDMRASMKAWNSLACLSIVSAFGAKNGFFLVKRGMWACTSEAMEVGSGPGGRDSKEDAMSSL